MLSARQLETILRLAQYGRPADVGPLAKAVHRKLRRTGTPYATESAPVRPEGERAQLATALRWVKLAKDKPTLEQVAKVGAALRARR